MACKDHLVVICLFFGLMAYIIIGGAIFNAMEYPREQENVQRALSAVGDFLAKHPCVNSSELATFLQDIRYLTDTGSEIDNTTQPTMWTFQSSFNFAATVVTTIGYGNQTPTTGHSQAFCVCFGMFGIPLCLVLLSKIGDRIANMNNVLVGKLVNWPERDRRRIVLTMGILSTVGFVLLVLIPSMTFTYMEGWPFVTSMYFTMVTLSTVGFGDYILRESVAGPGAPLWRIFTCLWIFTGLAWFSSIMTSIQERMTRDVNIISTTGEPKKEQTSAPETTKEIKIEDMSHDR